MIFVAATAFAVVPARNVGNYFVMLCRALVVAVEGRSFEGKSAEQIYRDPDLSFFTGTLDGKFIQIGDLPGRITFHWAFFSDSGPHLGRQFASTLCHVGWPFLTTWGIALLIARCRRPRPAPLQILQQPGFWVCCLPPLIVVLRFTLYMNVGYRLPPYAESISVAGAWVLLTISRAWRAERSWIDRTGRAFGVAWIISLPLWLWAE